MDQEAVKGISQEKSDWMLVTGQEGEAKAHDAERRCTSTHRAGVLLFKSNVAQVSVINPHDTVVLLEQTLFLSFASTFQALH